MTRASSSSSPAKSPAPAADVFGVVTGRAGRGAPSLDHAEPHSAWPLEPATRCWLVALRGYPEDTGPGRALPSPPAPPRQRLCKADNSDVRKIHSLISVLISSKFTYQDVPGGAGGSPPQARVFWGDSRSQIPISRGGLEWPRGMRLSVVWGGHPPRPRRAIVGTPRAFAGTRIPNCCTRPTLSTPTRPCSSYWSAYCCSACSSPCPASRPRAAHS